MYSGYVGIGTSTSPSGVDERRQRELDAFRRAGRDEHAIGVDRKAACRELRGDRFARRREALRRPVAVVAVAQRALDGLDQMRRRLEIERDRVADVEVSHAHAGRFDPLRFGDDVADGVGETVDALGDRNRRRRGSREGHGRILPRDGADNFYTAAIG